MTANELLLLSMARKNMVLLSSGILALLLVKSLAIQKQSFLVISRKLVLIVLLLVVKTFLSIGLKAPPSNISFANKEHSRFVNCVRFNEQGTLACSVGLDKKGIFYDGKDGTKKHELSAEGGHSGGIYAASWSADGAKLLTASGDKTSKVWDVETGKCISTHTFGNEIEDQQLGCIWIGNHLISMSLNGHLNYLDPSNPSKPRLVIKGHNKFITSLAVDRNKGQVYTGDYDAIITAWDIATGTNQVFEGKGHTNQVNEMHVAGDNLISSAKDDSVRFTSISSKAFGPDRLGLDGEGLSVSTNASGSVVIAASNNSVTIIRDKKTVGSVETKYGSKAVALSPDEKEVVVGGGDNHIYVYSLSGNSLTQTKKLEAHRGPLTCIAYSPDGKLIASGDTNREIIVWDSASKATKVTGWVFHSARVNCLAWSPDSTHVISGSLDQNLIVWNVNAPTTRIVIKNSHHGGVNAVAWISNDTAASAGQDCAWRTHSFKF